MTNYETVSSKGALGQKIGCITLTKQFYEKNNITNRGNKTLPISFTEFQGLPVQYMNQVHGTSMEEIKEFSDEPISNTDALIHADSAGALKVQHLPWDHSAKLYQD